MSVLFLEYGGVEDEDVGASLIDSLAARDGYADTSLLGFDELIAHARPSDRELLTRRFRGGEDMVAIAARLGVSHQRLAAALARIRKRVGDREPTCPAPS